MLAAAIGGGWMGPQRKPEHDKIVSMLCDTNVDLNAQDKDGFTALSWSLRSDNLEATKLLVAAGADRSLGKELGRDAITLANSAEKKEAIRTAGEREAREALTKRNSELIVGRWRDENSLSTYSAYGEVVTKFDDGRTISGNWSIVADILTKRNREARIVELTNSTFVFEDDGVVWHARRISQEELDAERAKAEVTRRMFVGTWKDLSDGDEYIFNDDGTMVADGRKTRNLWSIDGDRFTSGNGTPYRIAEINDTSFILKRLGGSSREWRATRMGRPNGDSPLGAAEPVALSSARQQIEQNYAEERGEGPLATPATRGHAWSASSSASLGGIPMSVAALRLEAGITKTPEYTLTHVDVAAGIVEFEQKVSPGKNLKIAITLYPLEGREKDACRISVKANFLGGMTCTRDVLCSEFTRLMDIAGGLVR
jgi:hypothetical protein